MDIFEAILASTSLFTAFVTAWVMIQQYLLQKKQLNAQQLEHQPLFEFVHKDDGSLLVRNTGVAMSSPATITVHSLLVIEYTHLFQQPNLFVDYIYSIWVEKYTSPHLYTNLQGDIFSCANLLAGKDELIDGKLSIIQSAINQQKTETDCLKVLNAQILDLVKIKYIDKYKIQRTLYFAGGKEVSDEFYKRVLVSAGNLTTEPRQMGTITTNDVLEGVLNFEYPISPME